MSGEGPPGPKPSILSLYAFDPDGASPRHPVWGDLLARRRKVFGARSLLSYDEPVEFVRGEGVWLYDRQGTPFLDAYNNVPSVGHAHPRVVEAISRQAAAVNTNTRYLDDVVCSYAEKLLSTFPPSLSNVVLTCTGSESVDLALRLMRNASGADGFVVTRFAYHGNTRASTEISPSYGGGAAPADHVRAVPPPDGYRGRGKDIGESFAEDVRQAIRDLRSRGIGFAGFVADTIFSSDGVFADPPGFLSKTAEVVRSEGGLFLADEVQPGLGRTGDSMWGFQRHGVLPDLVVLGKPMGNGLPVAGVVVRPDILGDFLRRTGYFNTFGGNSVCCAAGHAVLEIVESERLVENARQVGSRLIRGLSDLSRKYPLIGDVRGAGLYIGVELVKDPCSMEPASEEARRIVNGFRAKHVLIGATGQNGHILKIRPPLVFSRENAEQFLSVADEVLESTAK